jgi:hypothetical protein
LITPGGKPASSSSSMATAYDETRNRITSLLAGPSAAHRPGAAALRGLLVGPAARLSSIPNGQSNREIESILE